MQKHARKHRVESHLEPEIAGQILRDAHRHHGVRHHKRLFGMWRQGHLVKEHRHVRRNQRVVDDRKRSCGVVILQRNHVARRASVLAIITLPGSVKALPTISGQTGSTLFRGSCFVALFKLYFNCRLADARPVRVQLVANGVTGSRRKTPEPSRPATRIPAESHPRSPCKSSGHCKGDALRAKPAGTASPTHSPPACPPTSRNSSPALPNLPHWQRHRLVRAQTLRGSRDPPRCLAGHSPTSNPPYRAASLAAERVSPGLPVYLRRSSSSSRHPRCN